MGHWNNQHLVRGTLVVKPKEYHDIQSLHIAFSPSVEYDVDTLCIYDDTFRKSDAGIWFGFKKFREDTQPMVEIKADEFIIVRDDR